MDFLSDSTFWAYLGALFGPFVQEDASVALAASLSATKAAKTLPLYILTCIGLFFSDIWKYWVGWAALRNKKAKAFANKDQVMVLQDKVRSHTMATLLAARFVPLTRIPAYVACGFFGVSYPKYCVIIAFTAVLYASIVFAAFHVLGEILGEQLLWVMPIIAIAFVSTYVGYHVYKKRQQRADNTDPQA